MAVAHTNSPLPSLSFLVFPNYFVSVEALESPYITIIDSHRTVEGAESVFVLDSWNGVEVDRATTNKTCEDVHMIPNVIGKIEEGEPFELEIWGLCVDSK